MKNLYIDFDGVIMDTINVTYKMMDEIGVTTEEERATFYKNLDWKELLKNTPQINNGFECIEKIIESKLFDVAILTHVFSMDEAVAKVNHIRKYLKHITIIPVPKEVSKTKMVNAKDAILIDDYCGNLKEWEESGGIGIRFSIKRNGKGYEVVDYLDQAIDLYSEKVGGYNE